MLYLTYRYSIFVGIFGTNHIPPPMIANILELSDQQKVIFRPPAPLGAAGPIKWPSSVRASVRLSVCLSVTHFSRNLYYSFFRSFAWSYRSIKAQKWRSPIFPKSPRFAQIWEKGLKMAQKWTFSTIFQNPHVSFCSERPKMCSRL